MVSGKFIKRFEKLKKETDADIRITKRYFDDAEDTVFSLASFISRNITYKSIVINFEVSTTDNREYKLVFIVTKDRHGNIITDFKRNKALENFYKLNLIHMIGYKNNFGFNTVITSVDILKSKEYTY